MLIEMKLNGADGVINVTYNGPVNLEEAKNGVEKFCSLYSNMRPLLVLVDVRGLEIDLTFDEQKLFGEYVARHPKLADARVAVLYEESHNPSLFMDIHAFNKGLLLAEFSNEKDAFDWLKDI